VNHKVDNSQGSLFILPAKAPVTIENGDYFVPED
jgi:hypothetical protein